jgi:hypothetical protein
MSLVKNSDRAQPEDSSAPQYSACGWAGLGWACCPEEVSGLIVEAHMYTIKGTKEPESKEKGSLLQRLAN